MLLSMIVPNANPNVPRNWSPNFPLPLNTSFRSVALTAAPDAAATA